ncbi:hypothetical protein [Paenibacillus sp. FSL K6-1230]|uniref:hypothetical protein n=1 Tax=Paenibacillus sp. FSL K6-1230 TaxID=2921603 RepID=UPI0030F741CE
MKQSKRYVTVFMAVLCAGALLSGCMDGGNDKPQANEPQESNGQQALNVQQALNEQITNNATSLSAEQAKTIFKDIQDLYSSIYNSDINKLENFTIAFSNEQKQGTATFIDADVEVDMTLIRHPEDSPLIQGMKKAIAEIKNDADQARAETTMEGYLKEMEAEYKQTARVNAPMQIELNTSNAGDFAYTLYYLVENGGEITKYPAKEYFEDHFKENAVDKEQQGYDLIKQELAQ